MPFVALIDANPLVPGRLRGLLVGAAIEGLYEPAWTEAILEEVVRGVGNAHPDIPIGDIERNVDLLRRAVPSAMVTGYEALIPTMTNDEGDRHVLAAAVHRHADTIVTFNRKHFPESARRQYDVDLLTPDEFLLDLLDLDDSTMARVLMDQAAALRRPPMTAANLVDSMRDMVPRFVDTFLLRALREADADYIPEPVLEVALP
jgi:predicted nucleic acid-binding protein